MISNEYLPHKAMIRSIQRESFDTKTYRVAFSDRKMRDSFEFAQGQFAEISLPGAGEVPISIASSPTRKEFLEFTIRRAGKVTSAIHGLDVGDFVYLRGPYGNSFPYEELSGKNLYFVAGGIGLAPLRSLIVRVMDNRDGFNHLKILYGAQTPAEMCFKRELDEWNSVPNTEVWLTVDRPCEGWGCSVGVVTELWKETRVESTDAVAFVCGPPVMLKFAVMNLLDSGFDAGDIFITLERHMKCGVGKCGHCNVGSKFVCVDGPVFSYEQLRLLPEKEAVV